VLEYSATVVAVVVVMFHPADSRKTAIGGAVFALALLLIIVLNVKASAWCCSVKIALSLRSNAWRCPTFGFMTPVRVMLGTVSESVFQRISENVDEFVPSQRILSLFPPMFR
jgi:hypothetical protein